MDMEHEVIHVHVHVYMKQHTWEDKSSEGEVVGNDDENDVILMVQLERENIQSCSTIALQFVVAMPNVYLLE